MREEEEVRGDEERGRGGEREGGERRRRRKSTVLIVATGHFCLAVHSARTPLGQKSWASKYVFILSYFIVYINHK